MWIWGRTWSEWPALNGPANPRKGFTSSALSIEEQYKPLKLSTNANPTTNHKPGQALDPTLILSGNDAPPPTVP